MESKVGISHRRSPPVTSDLGGAAGGEETHGPWLLGTCGLGGAQPWRPNTVHAEVERSSHGAGSPSMAPHGSEKRGDFAFQGKLTHIESLFEHLRIGSEKLGFREGWRRAPLDLRRSEEEWPRIGVGVVEQGGEGQSPVILAGLRSLFRGRGWLIRVVDGEGGISHGKISATISGVVMGEVVLGGDGMVSKILQINLLNFNPQGDSMVKDLRETKGLIQKAPNKVRRSRNCSIAR